MKFFGKILISIGLLALVFGIYLIKQRNNPEKIKFTNTEISAKEISKIPNNLIIESQNIDLPVIESEIVNQKWEVTDKGVSRIGNVFYGHNWNNLLGKLIYVKPGDIIEIKHIDLPARIATQSVAGGSIDRYKVILTQEVNPDQKDVLNLATDDKILIYTCSGFLDSKRFVVVASKFSQGDI